MDRKNDIDVNVIKLRFFYIDQIIDIVNII